MIMAAHLDEHLQDVELKHPKRNLPSVPGTNVMADNWLF
jgi:hypothetical protein